MLDGSHIRRAAGECVACLGPVEDAEWSVGAPDLDMTVAGVVAHAAEVCLWYAIDLAAGGRDLPTVEHRVKPDAVPADLVATLTTYATVAARVVDAAPPEARGFHPAGQADPSGFAAMACDEMLVHTHDAARGLGLTFTPDGQLAEAVLRRLFPWVPVDAEPWQLLLWANGRVAVAGRARLSGWRWHCAPLDEWNGQPPVLSGPRLDEKIQGGQWS